MRRAKALSRKLSELRAQVLKWRERDGGRGSRIPDDLWEEAVRVAQIDGLYATARATGLQYARLKKRYVAAWPIASARTSSAAVAVGATAVASKEPRAVAVRRRGDVSSIGGQLVAEAVPQFIEVPLSPPTARQTTLELFGRRGERMRVELGGDIDMPALLRTFWSCQS